MSDPYQLGSDVEWLRHSNDEMTRVVKKRNRQLGRLRLFCFLLLVAAGWVTYQYSKLKPLATLLETLLEFRL